MVKVLCHFIGIQASLEGVRRQWVAGVPGGNEILIIILGGLLVLEGWCQCCHFLSRRAEGLTNFILNVCAGEWNQNWPPALAQRLQSHRELRGSRWASRRLLLRRKLWKIFVGGTALTVNIWWRKHIHLMHGFLCATALHQSPVCR